VFGCGASHTGALQYQLLPSQRQLSVPYRHSNAALAAHRSSVFGLVAGQTPQLHMLPTNASLQEQVTLPYLQFIKARSGSGSQESVGRGWLAGHSGQVQAPRSQ